MTEATRKTPHGLPCMGYTFYGGIWNKQGVPLKDLKEVEELLYRLKTHPASGIVVVRDVFNIIYFKVKEANVIAASPLRQLDPNALSIHYAAYPKDINSWTLKIQCMKETIKYLDKCYKELKELKV